MLVEQNIVNTSLECFDEAYLTDDENISNSSSSGENETLLQFAKRITEELKSNFKRNQGEDGFCEDVYEDKFSAPESGSISYYTDVLAMARLEGPSSIDAGATSKPSVVKENSEVFSLEDRPLCTWKCSGIRDECVGTGPLEDLFLVLDSASIASGAVEGTLEEEPCSSRQSYRQRPELDESLLSRNTTSIDWNYKTLTCDSPVGKDRVFDVSQSASMDDANFLDSFNRFSDDSLSINAPTTSMLSNALGDFRSFW